MRGPERGGHNIPDHRNANGFYPLKIHLLFFLRKRSVLPVLKKKKIAFTFLNAYMYVSFGYLFGPVLRAFSIVGDTVPEVWY